MSARSLSRRDGRTPALRIAAAQDRAREVLRAGTVHEIAGAKVNEFHEANRKAWNARAASWEERTDRRGNWKTCHQRPELALHARELSLLGDVAARDVCVLGSGHNEVAFALAGMGARVTSVDIAENQLDVARRRADQLGVQVRFLQADVVELDELTTRSYDIVYTGGHVAVWVADLTQYYSEALRILRPGGLALVREYHPFRRLWRKHTGHLELAAGYFDRGPHEFDCDFGQDTSYPAPPGLVEYEFHWTVSDYLTALLDAGLQLQVVGEYGAGHQEWETTPLAGLPEWLLIFGRKLHEEQARL